MALSPVNSRVLPLTYIWHTPDEVSTDLSSPSHVTLLGSFLPLFCLPPFHINLVESSISDVRSPHSTQLHMPVIATLASDQWRAHRATVALGQPKSRCFRVPILACNCRLTKLRLIVALKGMTAFQLLIFHMSNWLNETLKNAIYSEALWGEPGDIPSILGHRSIF